MSLTIEQHNNLVDWIDELRSGKYEQGRKALKTEYKKYCCLGIACEIKKVENRIRLYDNKYEFIFGPGTIASVTYPDNAWMENNYGINSVGQTNLSKANDGYFFVLYTEGEKQEAYTFSEIADVLEMFLVSNGEWKL